MSRSVIDRYYVGRYWSSRADPGEVAFSVRDITSSRAPSVWILFIVPGLLAIQGAICAAILPWPRFGNLSEDAQRGLDQQRGAMRIFFVGIGVLIATIQLLTILQAIGVALPPEFDIRVLYFVYGVLLAYAGNFAPKMPAIKDKWLGIAAFLKANRFVGWVFMIGGILISLAALTLPAEHVQPTSLKLLAAMFGLPVLHAVLLLFAYRNKPT